MITIYSLFRDVSTANVQRYFRQLAAQTYKGFQVVAIEGDSKNNTYNNLITFGNSQPYAVKVLKHDTGKPHYGSVENPDRFLLLSEMVNYGFDNFPITGIGLHLESDLIIPPDMLSTLLEKVDATNAVSPTILAKEVNYDIWAFRKNGQRQSPFDHPKEHYVEMDSTGSVVMYPGRPVQEGLRFGPECIKSFTEDLNRKGIKVWWDTQCIVHHPA
jgi:hypothetical protein